MKRVHVFFALSAIVLFFSNCKKYGGHGGNAASHYALQSFVTASDLAPYDSILINYNNAGDPVSVLRTVRLRV